MWDGRTEMKSRFSSLSAQLSHGWLTLSKSICQNLVPTSTRCSGPDALILGVGLLLGEEAPVLPGLLCLTFHALPQTTQHESLRQLLA